MKWILKSVVNLTQKSRPQTDREQLTGELHRVTGFEATRLLEHLQLGSVTSYADYLRLELCVTNDHIGDLVLTNAVVELDRDHGTADADDFPFCVSHPFCLH